MGGGKAAAQMILLTQLSKSELLPLLLPTLLLLKPLLPLLLPLRLRRLLLTVSEQAPLVSEQAPLVSGQAPLLLPPPLLPPLRPLPPPPLLPPLPVWFPHRARCAGAGPGPGGTRQSREPRGYTHAPKIAIPRCGAKGVARKGGYAK